MQFQDIFDWMMTLSQTYGYLGILLISLIGAASIIFPLPYTVVIFTLGGLQRNGNWIFEPFWMAVAAGTGATIGEFTSYFVGLGGRKVMSEKLERKMDVLAKVLKKYGSIVIFIFALTPLPDDLLFIPLGVMHYSIIRAFIPAWIGKFTMNLIVGYSGRYSIQAIKNIFGIESDWMIALIGMVTAITLLIIILIVMFKVDWEKHLEKYLTQKEGSDKQLESDS